MIQSNNLTLSNVGDAAGEWSIAQTPAWLEANVSQGTLEPTESIEVVFTADLDQSVGMYSDGILFQIDGEEVSVQANLNITSRADIVARSSSLSFSDIAAPDRLTLTNDGNAAGTWSIKSAPFWLKASATEGTLEAGESVNLEFETETINNEGTYTGNLIISLTAENYLSKPPLR